MCFGLRGEFVTVHAADPVSPSPQHCTWREISQGPASKPLGKGWQRHRSGHGRHVRGNRDRHSGGRWKAPPSFTESAFLRFGSSFATRRSDGIGRRSTERCRECEDAGYLLEIARRSACSRIDAHSEIQGVCSLFVFASC